MIIVMVVVPVNYALLYRVSKKVALLTFFILLSVMRRIMV